MKKNAVATLARKNISCSSEAALKSLGNATLLSMNAIAIRSRLFPITSPINDMSAELEMFASSGTKNITKKSWSRRMEIIILPSSVFAWFLSESSFTTIIVEEKATIVPTNSACSRLSRPKGTVRMNARAIIISTCRSVPIIIGFPICRSFFTEVSIPIENIRKAAPSSERSIISGVISAMPAG
jgi:hypothetical protein